MKQIQKDHISFMMIKEDTPISLATLFLFDHKLNDHYYICFQSPITKPNVI